MYVVLAAAASAPSVPLLPTRTGSRWRKSFPAIAIVVLILVTAIAYTISDKAGSFFMSAVVFVIGTAIYFAPAITAWEKSRKNTTAILSLNLLLGWTFIGWVVSLVWALTDDK